MCARCYSLRNYGKVKNEAAEILMPPLDFGRVVGDRLSRVGPGGAVVLCLVDLIDFDGSFPVDAVDILSPYVANESVDVLLVGTKVDLLPTQCTRARVTSFVRRRAKDLGLKRASGVHLVSAHTGMGVNILSEQLETLLDEGREVWVVGAQNAGKSSLINRLSKSTGVPGPRTADPSRRTCREPRSASSSSRVCCPTARTSTTLPVCCSRFRSPVGSPTRRLARFCPASDSPRERTERRLEAPSTSAGWRASTSWTARSALYTSPCGRRTTCPRTTWCGAKGGKADAFYEKHAGGKLSPPCGENRVAQLGEWGCRTVTVYGESWQRSDRDISIGGLGWVGVGVNGNASFRVWTHEGVQVETREALGARHEPGPVQAGVQRRAAAGRRRGQGETEQEDHAERGIPRAEEERTQVQVVNSARAAFI